MKYIEDTVAKVEIRQREHRRRTGKRLPQFAPPEWLCPGVGLVGVVRFVPLSQMYMSSHYPQHRPPSPQAGVCEFRVFFGPGRVLPELRRLAECERHSMPRPLGVGPLKQSLSERTLRGRVISRYLSFGSGGPYGAKTVGLLLGVVQTVRMAGLNAYTWVHDWLGHARATVASHPRTCARGCRGR